MRTDDREGNARLRRRARLAVPKEVLEGLAEYEDHVLRGGFWYRDRLSYEGPQAEWAARTQHHRGRRRSAKKRMDELLDRDEREWQALLAQFPSLHATAPCNRAYVTNLMNAVFPPKDSE